jgi:hypothetical protein
MAFWFSFSGGLGLGQRPFKIPIYPIWYVAIFLTISANKAADFPKTSYQPNKSVTHATQAFSGALHAPLDYTIK